MLAMTVTRTALNIMYAGSKHVDSRWKRARLISTSIFERGGTRRFCLPQRIARTLVGQEHAPTETSRPCSLAQTPYGRLQSFGAARPWLRPTWFGAHGSAHTCIPRKQSEDRVGTRFALAFMYSLFSANTSELSSS